MLGEQIKLVTDYNTDAAASITGNFNRKHILKHTEKISAIDLYRINSIRKYYT